MMNTRCDVGLIALTIALAASASTAASAQSLPPNQPSADQPGNPNPSVTANPSTTPNDKSGLGEIVVTAQRRSESAQRVPIAITAFSADSLKSKGAASNEDLPLLIPGLTLQPSGSASPISLRGVGNSSSGAVLTFIDGVLQPFDTGTQVFNNVSSIEVDKGPQGTLFGRNATGGVIQITTKDPAFKPAADLSFGYGNYNTVNASAYATTAIGSSVATDLSFYYNNQQDGWGKNFATGKDVFKKKDLSLRTKTLFDVSDNTKIRLMLDYKTSTGSVGVDISPSRPTPILFNEATGEPLIIPGHYNVDSNYTPDYHVKEGGAAVRVDHDFGILKGVSITSYRRVAVDLNIDYDGTPIDFLRIARHDDQHDFTQEFQLLSPDGSKIKWVLGAFYFHLVDNMEPFGFGGIGSSVVFGAPSGVPYNIYATSTLDSYAGFGQATVKLLEHTRLTGGIRYTIDDAKVKGFDNYGSQTIPGTAGSGSKTFRKATFRAILEQDITPTVLTYASFNRGFNSGVYNLVNPAGFVDIQPVKPETIDAYEVGIKSEFLDHRLRFNASGFWYNYSNLQQQIYESGGLVIVNAAAARIRGIDADLTARPTRNLTLSGGIEYLDSIYTKYPNAPFYTVAPNHALVASSGDATGNRTTYAPKVSYNLAGTYTINAGVGKFDTNAVATYTGSYFNDASNNIKEPGHFIVNLTESWTSSDQKTQVSLYVKNLANKFYDVFTSLLTPIGAVSNPGAPRTFGFTATRHF